MTVPGMTAPLRWSLRSLASFSLNPDNARVIIQDIANRLAWQQLRLQKLPEDSNLRHLLYLHKDTERLCRQIVGSESSSQVLVRWSDADQRVVSTTLEQVRDRHASALERLVELVDAAQGASDVERQVQSIAQDRWGIQLLCDHYVKLYKAKRPHGAVSVNCNLLDVVEEAVTEAKHVCEAHCLASPDIDWKLNSNFLPPLSLVRPWVHHSMVELLKNGMNASVKDDSANPPSMKLDFSVVDDKLIQVDIRDYGIGLPPDKPDTEIFFRMGHSASAKRWDRLQEQQSYAAVRSPMSSLGVGLTVSRMMMRHFGGNVELFRNDVGTTARVSLPLQDDILERESNPVEGLDM